MRGQSDIQPPAYEINELTDGNAEIIFYQNVTPMPCGWWQFDYFVLTTKYYADIEIVMLLFYDLFLLRAKGNQRA